VPVVGPVRLRVGAQAALDLLVHVPREITRARRETSSPRTIPTRPRLTSDTSR
jgi:hypothetical protein